MKVFPDLINTEFCYLIRKVQNVHLNSDKFLISVFVNM